MSDMSTLYAVLLLGSAVVAMALMIFVVFFTD